MKRILSLLVVFAMVISMVPNVFAAKDSIDMDELLGKLVYLESIDTISVSMAEGANSKTYKWTPDEAGVLSLAVNEEMPEGTELSIVMTQGDKSVTYNPDELFELEVVAGQEVTIVLTKSSEAALAFTAYGSVTPPLGSEENPIFLAELENKVQVTAEPTWFQGYFNGTTMTVTGTGAYSVTVNGEATAAVDGVVTMPVSVPGFRMPFVFNIDKAGDYTINFEYPQGSRENPEILFRPNYIAVDIAEGNDQGYYYKWTATDKGTLKLTCPAVEGVEYDVNMLNMSSYAQAWLQDSTDGTISLDVKAGDEVIIQVTTIPDENFNYPALQTAITGEFIFAIGHQQNPEVLFRPQYIQVNIEEGNSQGYYYKWTATDAGTLKLTCPAVEGVEYDVVLTNMSNYKMAWLQDSTDGTVSIDVNAGDEVVIQVVTVPDKEFNYPALQTAITGEFVFPIGHQQNPEILFRPQYIQVNVAEGNDQGYYYKWTATDAGKLTLTCPAVEGVEYDVILTNMSNYKMAWLQDSTDGTVSIDVKAGDEVIIQVVTVPDKEFNYPALQTAITGVFEFAVGHQQNPEVLTSVESIKVNVEEGNTQGYYYKWVSDTDGKLTLTCPAVEGVEYDVVLTNMSNYKMAWLQDSTDGTVSIDVKTGDEIIIQVVTVPDKEFNYPALETTLTGVAAEITYTVGDLDGNGEIDEDDAIYLLQYVLLGEDNFPVNQPADYDKSGEVDEDDAIYLLQYVLLGEDNFPLA